MQIVKSLEDAGLLTKDVNETVENEVKEQKGGFLGMLAATLGDSLLGSILSGKYLLKLYSTWKKFMWWQGSIVDQ